MVTEASHADLDRGLPRDRPGIPTSGTRSGFRVQHGQSRIVDWCDLLCECTPLAWIIGSCKILDFDLPFGLRTRRV